jgi:hypothetical protein
VSSTSSGRRSPHPNSLMLRDLPRRSRLDPLPPLRPAPRSTPLPPLPPLPRRRERLRILSFDIENRPLSYWYDGKATAEVTAIAYRWVDEPTAECWTLTRRKDSGRRMLGRFVERYNAADVVTGHYIRRHDLRLLNGAMLEYGLPCLSAKLVQDTCVDLKPIADLSRSQANLAEMVGVTDLKPGMSQADWRDANRLTPEGIIRTKERCIGDVHQQVALRARLLELGWLKKPRMWGPG